MEIKREEGEKWPSQKKIDDGRECAATTEVAPTRAGYMWLCVM
jgi:hypothetical protein